MENRVVITGMGAVTPLGNTVEDFWNGLKNGKCGIDFITEFDPKDYSAKLAGEVKDFNPADYMDFKQVKRMDRFCQLAMVAAKEAVKDSKIDLESIDKERFGVIVSSGIGGIGTIETQHEILLQKGPRRLTPLIIPMIITNMAAGNIAIEFGAKGMCTNVVTACATGNNSIGDAFRHLKHGYADIMLAGGAEGSITPLSIAGFAAARTLSTSTDPLRASIPFDAERNGFVMGEGSGIIMLETLEHAKKRSAKIYAEIVGYGSTCDAYHITLPAPEGEGGARAMRLSLKEANVACEEVSYINAHGTSTPANDKLETAAIKSVFGDYAYKLPISSTKSMTGHLLGAAGAIEAIASIKAIENNFIPPTIGLKVKDSECDLDYVPNVGRQAQLNYVMSNSLGFGGHNATLLFKKWQEA